MFKFPVNRQYVHVDFEFVNALALWRPTANEPGGNPSRCETDVPGCSCPGFPVEGKDGDPPI
jgi:hypothetical protein